MSIPPKKASRKSAETPAKKPSAKAAPKPVQATDEDDLSRYRAKRDFTLTSEPGGDLPEKPSHEAHEPLPFVIQKHAATRLHYDFRLAWNGVMKSWAVARGPSYYTRDKRLAVEVEDHPMDYRNFEGIIPKGQYGGGTVMVWDRGTWEPHVNVDEGLRNGSLKFALHGEKMKGNWALVRMNDSPNSKYSRSSKPNWLLIKEHDDFERPADAEPVTEAQPDSVISGRSLEAIAEDKDKVWNSNQNELPSDETAKVAAPIAAAKPEAAEPKAKAKKSAAKASNAKASAASEISSNLPKSVTVNLGKAPNENLPAFIAPQLAERVSSPAAGEGWLHELKLDGYRIQARIQRDSKKSEAKVQLLTRTGLDWTHRIKSVAQAVAALPVDSALLDGEVAVLTEDGTTSFAELQAAFQDGVAKPLTYFVFDLLHLNGHNLRGLPLEERKGILTGVLAAAPEDADAVVRLSKHLETDPATLFGTVCEMGAEGIISKRANSAYVSGRGSSWLKLKCYREQELVIGGFTLPTNGSHGVGALLLGYYRGSKLVYAGRTGTGFTQKTHRMIRDRLEAMRCETSPFAALPGGAGRGVHWVKPELVAQISFSNWTADDLVRQASFKGLREDKPAKEVTREEPAGQHAVSNVAASEKKAEHRIRPPVAARSVAAVAHVRLTHPEKVLDADSGLTKQQLANYYSAASQAILTYIANRPLSLVRCPEGTGHECFFQKHNTHTLPDGIGSVEIVDKKSGKLEPYITIDDAHALVSLAQMSVLELHVWGSTNDALETPDRIVFDLDPSEEITWKTLGDSALDVRQRLKKLGLESFLKTTGGKGLHIVAPIEPTHAWPEVKQFAHDLVLAMEREQPRLYLTKMTKAARTGKIYLDYLRNERGSTSIAPFSPRSRPGMPVSLPLDWSELKLKTPPRFLVADFAKWKVRLDKNPWKEIDSLRQQLKIA